MRARVYSATVTAHRRGAGKLKEQRGVVQDNIVQNYAVWYTDEAPVSSKRSVARDRNPRLLERRARVMERARVLISM